MALTRTRRRARAVYGGLGHPVEGGAMVVQEAAGDAVVLYVGSDDEAARRWPDAGVRDDGFALSPAPVNAHVHLDLSTMPHAPGDYEAFVRAVLAHGAAGGRGLEAAKVGLAEVKRSGVAAFGDVVADEAVMHWLLEQPNLTGVAYWEVVAPDPADADRVFDDVVAKLRAFRARARPDGLRVGLSPHAPHTVSAPLLAKLAKLAKANDLPLQIHVAESPSEVRLHRSGDGPLRELMGDLMGAFRPSGRSPVGYLASLGVLEAAPTLVHGVQVDEADVNRIERSGSVVVHCPRSNAALDTGRFPWETYAAHGATVAFGTDSRGSSPSLDVQAEVAAAQALHGERAHVGGLVRAAVKGGYRALGLATPRITRGVPADAVATWRIDADGAVAPPAGGDAAAASSGI